MKKVWAFFSGYWKSTDRWLLFFWLTTTAVSVLFLYGIYHSDLMLGAGRIYTQIGASCVGLFAALTMSLINYHTLLKFWKLFLPACLILVLMTFFIGIARGGDQAWIPVELGQLSFTIQPSEFLKISMIMTFSLHLNHVKEALNRPLHLLLLCLHGGAHVLLIQMQDSGTALIFVLIFLIMIFFAGIALRYIAAAVLLLVPAAVFLWFRVLTVDQQLRFLTIYSDNLAPELYERYIYQQQRGLLALGIGGVQGTGVFSGKHIDIPEIYNDFIFNFIGESAGLMGCLGVIALLCVVSLKLLYNSSVAIDDTGRFVCVGVFAMIASQTVINLGMCVKLLPVIGVTLPLISSGGSSVLALYLGLGLVLSVYRHSGKGLFYTET